MTWDPVHDSRKSFLVCLRAQCAPGDRWGPLPSPGLSRQPGLDAAGAVLLTLLDPGLSLAVAGSEEAGQVAGALREATGAGAAPVEEADFVLADRVKTPVADRARRGSALFPEQGATIVYCLRSAAATSARLAGPGVAGTLTVPLGLPERELAALARANADPPAGVDAFVVQAPDLVAVPRSVTVRPEAA